jgi:hypothetical protein
VKAFALAIIAAVVLAGASALVLTTSQRAAYEAFATSAARVSPNSNLVGKEWSGNPSADEIEQHSRID